MPIHHAITEGEYGGPDGEIQNWVSLDGQDWLPVQRGPVPSDHEDDVRKVFEGDGNFMPLRFGRSYLEHMGAEFKTT